MAGLFDDIKAKAPKLPDNVQVNTGLFRDLMPNEKNQTFKLTTEGNPGESIDFSDIEKPGLFDDLKPETQKEDIDGDQDLWQKVKFAAGMGFADTYRGVKQLAGFDLEKMREDQKKLYEFMQDPDGSTNYMVAAAYFGSALLDPAGWLIPVTKAKTLYQAAKYGFVSSGIVGGLGYVDEESILDTRAKQAAASAIGGTIVSPIIAGVGKKIKGEKVFTRESLGIPGFEPTVKAQADAQLQRIKLTNEAGKKDRDAFVSKKIKEVVTKDLEDMPQSKTKLLRGPRLFVQEYMVKPYQNKFGKPLLNYVTNGEYGAEAGGALTGAASGFALSDEEAPITTKLGVAFTGALAGTLGFGGIKRIKVKRTFGKGDEAIEVTESIGDILGRNLIDNYQMPKNFKKLKAEAQGFSNHIGMRFSFLAQKIKLQLSPDEQKILFNILEGDVKHSVKTKSLTNLSKESRDLITEIAQEYVDMGLISPATFKRNKDIYLKRSYRGKLEDRPFGEELKTRGATLTVTKDEYNKIYKKQKAYTTTTQELDKKGIFKQAEGKGKLIKNHRGWELLGTSQKEFKKLKANDEVQIRWDFTKQQRVGLGEIEDAAFAIAETGRGFAQTISQYRFYQNLSKQDYVYDGIKNIPVTERIRYKKMPTTVISKTDGKQRYGALSGKYVPEEIYKNLVAANKYTTAPGSSFTKNYRKLNSYWKVSKTAWNPTVHVNNVMSNFILHDLVDADYKYLKPAWTALTTHGKTITKGGKTSIQKSKLVEAATKYGVFDADFVTQELKNIKVDSKFPYNFNDTIDPFNHSVNAARNVFDDVKNKNILTTLTNFYRFEDAVFRLSVFQDRIAKGFDYADAALDARRAFIDYNIDAPAINWMRNNVTPFLAYTYRIIPILAETFVVRPWKYVKWGALGYGLNKMGDLVSGGDEEAERALMPERKQGSFFGMPFLPYRNIKIPVPKIGEEQQSYYMDLTRFVPGGDIFDLGNPGIPGLPAPFQPSFGVGGEILFPMLGYDLFRGEKIKGQTGMFKEDLPIRLNAVKDKLVPNIPFLPGSYSSQKLEKTRKGLDSPFVPDQSELTALMQTLGFKIERAELDKLKTGKVYELKRKLKGFEEQINLYRNDFRKGLINRETAKTKIDEVAKKMRELAEKYGVYFEKATYSQPKEPFESVKGLFERQN